MRKQRFNWKFAVPVMIGLALVVVGILLFRSHTVPSHTPKPADDRHAANEKQFAGRILYNDRQREVVRQSVQNEKLRTIADQPGTTWLTGPHASDVTAEQDVQTVARTSEAASRDDAVAVYQLYAIPDRDACAPYSSGGFSNAVGYSDWIDRIVRALKGDAVFLIEADAIAHTVQAGCMTDAAKRERLSLIAATVDTLKASPRVMAVYLDAAHSEWFADSSPLVEPLRQAGVMQADGVVVNVSNFIATPVITPWVERLVAAIGGQDLGAVIDTSRNGRGAPDMSVTGERRWCNPDGRGLGIPPTTDTDNPIIDAYLWVKNPGESDGNCFGNPPAGTFNVPKALELIENAE